MEAEKQQREKPKIEPFTVEEMERDYPLPEPDPDASKEEVTQ